MKSFDVDRHRDNQAQLAGWRILRFTWEDITERPEAVVASIQAGLEA
jgi:very-short-patch-repair endonuclease